MRERPPSAWLPEWLPKKQSDRVVIGVIGGALLIGIVVALWPADDPAPSGTWRYFAPEITYVTDALFPTVTIRSEDEACRALLRWTRSYTWSYQRNTAIESVGLTASDYGAAVLRCAAVGVWPS